MNIEDFRAYCLSLGDDVSERMPFGKAASEYDRNILVFYTGDKWFCFVNIVEFDRVNVKCDPDEACRLRERYAGVGFPYHMNRRHWIGVEFGGDVPDAEILRLVRRSHDIVAASSARGTRRKRKAVERE